MGLMHALGGENVERALRALERIAKALEEANKAEAARLRDEQAVRRARARA